MATYKEIQLYVNNRHGFVPQTCWIAYMKEVCRIPVKMAHNRYSVDKHDKSCPPYKMDIIKEAFRHFEMYSNKRLC